MRLIRRFVFWFAEYFPFLFPLLLAAFFLVQINTAFAADEVPADSVPAEPCEDWITSSDYGNTLPWAGKTGCSAPEAAEFGAAAFDAQFDFDANFGAGLIEEHSPHVHQNSEGIYYFGSSYKKCTRKWGPGGACDQWENGFVYGGMAYKKSENVSYRCPPRSFPDYKIGPLEKEDGSKWCAKQPSTNTCSDKANTEYSTPVYFYSLDLSEGLLPTCKEGCEVVSNGSGVCFPITLPSGTNADKCIYSSAMFTGNQCPFDIGEAPATSTGDEVGTPKEPSSTQQDCVPTYNAATGTTSCTGVKNTENPGTSSCGTINGTWTCVPNNDGGSSTTTDQREIINSTDPVTGNTTTTDRTTSTTVTCKGSDCTSTAKTTTTTTVRGADGSVISSSTGCVGSGCGAGAPGDPGAEDGEPTAPEYPDMPDPNKFSDDVNAGFDTYEDAVLDQFGGDDYEYMGSLPQSTQDKMTNALMGNTSESCSNPVIPVGPWSFTADLCYFSSKIRPYLDFIALALTLIYCWHLLRDAIYNTGA